MEQYNQYSHIINIISSSMIRNLWVASVEDFINSDIFNKNDLLSLIVIVRDFVVNTIVSERPLYELERMTL